MRVIITDGQGQTQIKSGTYSVTSITPGYDNTSINPSSLTVDKTTGEYSFTIAATGTLTLHVTETGETSGTPVVQSTFKRCDKDGNVYGSEIISGPDGNAVFEHVPYDASGNVSVYYKQIGADSIHEFDDSLKTVNLTSETTTVEVINPQAITRIVKLVDTNYSNLPIESAELTLT